MSVSGSDQESDDTCYCERDQLIQVLNESRSSEDLNDVKIELLDNEHVVASKFVLSARSEYFAGLFRFNNNSSPDKEGGQTVVQIACTKKVMNLVLDCLYGVEVEYEKLKTMECLEYLDILRMMMMEKAYDHMENYLLENAAVQETWQAFFQVLEKTIELQFVNIVKELVREFEDLLDRLMDDIEDIEDITDISKEALLLLLETGNYRQYQELARLKLYNVWIKNEQNQLTDEEHTRLSATFDLKNFTVTELLSEDVVECGFFALKDIHNAAVERHLEDIT